MMRAMCNRARLRTEPETLREKFGAKWGAMIFNRSPVELTPKARAPIIVQTDGQRTIEMMGWDVLGGQAPWPMTNVRNLALPQWRRLAENTERRCLIPLTEFCEWTPEPAGVNAKGKPIKGEMWFEVTDQPLFAVAGFWQPLKDDQRGFTMVTCDPNELVAPIHPKAMITILSAEDHEKWLTCSYDEVVALQRPYPADRMTVRGPEFPTRAPKAESLL